MQVFEIRSAVGMYFCFLVAMVFLYAQHPSYMNALIFPITTSSADTNSAPVESFVNDIMPRSNDSGIIPFYYITSPLYEFFNQRIKTTLSDVFEVHALITQDLTPGSKKHTFFGGVTIKVDAVVEAIQHNMGSHIIFSDVTIFINNRTVLAMLSYIKTKINNDIVFAYQDDGYNIGFMLIRCTKAFRKPVVL